MAGEAWYYIAPFQPDVNKALQDLRRREFEAGRYNPVQPFPEFPVDLEKPGPGAQHASIEEAREASDMDGTRSILDMDQVGTDPEPGMVTELPADVAEELFGGELLAVLGQLVDRGQGVYHMGSVKSYSWQHGHAASLAGRDNRQPCGTEGPGGCYCNGGVCS